MSRRLHPDRFSFLELINSEDVITLCADTTWGVDAENCQVNSFAIYMSWVKAYRLARSDTFAHQLSFKKSIYR